ncbi:hypothetical protein FRC15_000426 [Serendipita sp. 397]|nr:hypothetical protein FRC15_000426 [Serendipita sp. 397]
MANSIFASLASQEDRQICELMAARNLGTSDCESILFLTGISATSPYYCPPSIRSRGLFRYLKERAMRLVSRIEKIPTISLVSPITENTAPITAPARVLVPDDQHPLSMSTISEPIEHSANEEPSSSSPPPQGAGPSTLFASLLSYQSTIAVRLANILSLAQAQQTTPAQEQITSLQVEESEEKVQPTSSVSPSRATGKNTIYRAVELNQPTCYVTSHRRAHLFNDLSIDSDVQKSSEALPLLTPLERAIAQARADGYHLHPRTPLPAFSSLSPISPISPTLKLSPPGLTNLKQRYVLRSHQISASDFFRKEASHRAAVATRNANRGLLIGKKDWSMYEPSGLVMPDEEVTRLRVVLCPRRLPVRLWKVEYRGPQDWFEVEERNCTGGPAVFKRNSHLRAELDLTPPSDPAPAYTPSPTSGEAPCGLFTETEQVEEKILPPTPGPDTSTPSLKTTTEIIPSASEVVEEQPAVIPPTPVEVPSSTPISTPQTSSRTPFKTLLRTLATSARRRRAQGSAASSDSGTTKPIDQAVSSVPNPNVIALSKSSPIQRLKAAAFRAIPASLTPSSEETNRMDAIKCAPPEQPHPVVRPQLSKLQTQLNRDLKPECLDQSLAEAHRKALLNKYFGPSGSNNRQANAILYTSSLRRSSSDDVAGKSCSEAIIDNEGMDDDDDLVGATDIESSSDEDTLYTGESVEPAQDSLSEGSKSVLYDSADSTFSKAAWSSSSTPLSKPGIQLTNSMPLAGIV